MVHCVVLPLLVLLVEFLLQRSSGQVVVERLFYIECGVSRRPWFSHYERDFGYTQFCRRQPLSFLFSHLVLLSEEFVLTGLTPDRHPVLGLRYLVLKLSRFTAALNAPFLVVSFFSGQVHAWFLQLFGQVIF